MSDTLGVLRSGIVFVNPDEPDEPEDLTQTGRAAVFAERVVPGLGEARAVSVVARGLAAERTDDELKELVGPGLARELDRLVEAAG